jgi:hypothetical protein
MKIVKIFALFLLINSNILWSDDFIGWKKTTTEHFTFIFEEKDINTALELAEHSEEIYSLVCGFFDYYPSKVNVYLNGNIDSPNGFFYPIPGSINLYPAYPLNSGNTTKSEFWLYELLLHEMVHYVNLENPLGFFGGLSHLFGKDLATANGAFLPAWLVEGIAVYLETKFTKGGRGRNQYFEAYNKAAAIEENYYSIYQLAYSSDFPPYNRIYSGGYLLTSYLLKNYGEDIFQKIYRRYSHFPFLGPFSAITKETGKDIKEIFENLKTDEIEKYSDCKDLVMQYPSSQLSPSTFSDWNHPVPTDKGIMVYRTHMEKKSAIVLIDQETGMEEVLLEVELMDKSSFSSDYSGDTIILSKGDYSAYHMYGYSLKSNLYLFQNGKTRRLTEGESLFQPALSPDGRSIVAVQRIGSYSRLVTVNKQSGEITSLFEKEQTNVMNPSFSPSGEKLTVTINDHGYQDIYILNLHQPLQAVPLYLSDCPSEYFPRFITENELSFISDREGDLSLYSFNLENGEITLRFKDSVGVMDGFIMGDSVYYDSYRTKGFTVRKGLLPDGIKRTVLEESEVPSVSVFEAQKIKTYIDWTLPYLWLPKPEINISTSEGIQWGIGTAVWAGSYGQSGTWFLDFNYLPELEQLSGSFDYSQQLGTWTFSYSFQQTYNEIEGASTYYWEQETYQSVQMIFPLYEKQQLNWRNVLRTYVSFSHQHKISELSGFTFSESQSMEKENYLYGGTGLIFNGYNTNYPAKSVFGDLSIYNQIDFSVLLPQLSSPETVYLIKDTGALKLPFGPEGFLLQTGWKGAYQTNGYSSTAVNARGWSSSQVNSDISVLYNIDYLMPIAVVDWGMPYGFNIQNIAASIHLEGISNFTFEGTRSHEFFSGLEFIGSYGYNYGEIPAGAGINFRIFNKGESFTPEEDIKIYFFLSFNSLY